VRHCCSTPASLSSPLQWKAFAAANPEVLVHVAVSAGTSEKDFAMLVAVCEAIPGVQAICLDVANGYSEHFVDTVKRVRTQFPEHILIAGNVVTGEMTEELILSGADIVKIGIGPGSVCTTRVKTGVGYPQLSAVIECADAAHGLGGHVISDGGCKVSRKGGMRLSGVEWSGGVGMGHERSLETVHLPALPLVLADHRFLAMLPRPLGLGQTSVVS
jgi:GMP reductase